MSNDTSDLTSYDFDTNTFTVHSQYASEQPRIDPSEKKRWVKALRSGSYKQGYGELRTPSTGGFCCLGVYCDIKEIPAREAATKTFASGTEMHLETTIYGEGDEASWSVIPGSYAIPFADPDLNKDAGCTPYYPLTGDQVIFISPSQGSQLFADGRPERGFFELARYTLPSLNDSRQFTFDQIADIINYFL